MKKQDNHQSEHEFLNPLKARPGLEPDSNFVNTLRKQLIMQSGPRKSRLFQFVPIIVSSLAIITFTILTIFYLNEDHFDLTIADEKKEKEPVQIAKTEEVRPLFEIEYGTGQEEVAVTFNSKGGSGPGVSSFFVKDNEIYLLDNFNKKVVIRDQTGNLSSFPLVDSGWLEDIALDSEHNIYVLDSGKRVVYQHRKNGEYVKSYEIPDSLKIPTGLTINNNGDVIVNETFNMITNENINSPKTFDGFISVKGMKVNEELGKIVWETTEEKREIEIPFEESYGGLSVQQVIGNTIMVEKMEVAANIPRIMVESHIYIMDREGEMLGAVRVPSEKLAWVPTHLLRIDGNRIYFLSPEAENLVVYELIPGKQYEKRLKERINTFIEEQSLEKEGESYNVIEEEVEIMGQKLTLPQIEGTSPSIKEFNEIVIRKVNELFQLTEEKFPEEQNKEYDLEVITTYERFPYISINFSMYYAHENIAHPVYFPNFLTFNVEEGKELNLFEIIYNQDELQTYVRQILKQNYHLDDQLVQNYFLGEDQKFYLKDESVVLYFDRYEYNSIAPIEIEIPREFVNEIHVN